MRNLRLIFSREYKSRITDKWFWVVTLLGPVFIALIAIVPGVITYVTSQSETQVAVVDNTNTLKKPLSETDTPLNFTFPDRSSENLKNTLKEDTWEGIVVIPSNGIEKPDAISYISYSNPSLPQQSSLNTALTEAIKTVRYEQAGINQERLKELNPEVSVQTQLLGDQTASSGGAAYIFGFATGFIMYAILVTYGSMVMKSVLQEKRNRLADIIVSSVRPLDLMLGKITAIIALSLTQIALWIGLGTLLISGARAASLPISDNKVISDVFSGMETLNLVWLILLFVVMFLGGYLLYASFFAAISSASNPDADVQSVQQLIIFPIIISLFIMVGALQNPDGVIAFWGSIIPFSSPMVMLARFPFQVPIWEIALSIVLLYGSAFLVLWLAARIYRVAILSYGQRPGPRKLLKWMLGQT